MIAFINKMDRVGADFEMSVESIHKKLGANAWPVLLPLGKEGQLRGQLARHEAQFYEGANAVLQQPVVNLIYVREIVNGSAARIFSIYADFVVENGVESDVFEVGCAFHVAQIAGLPQSVVRRAAEILKALETDELRRGGRPSTLPTRAGCTCTRWEACAIVSS